MRTAVITGANAGLGFQTALALARTGARIVMACRNMEKAQQARSDLLAAVPVAQAIVLPLDVSELSSIREFGREFAGRVGELHILVNNAGVVGIPLGRNSAGHELNFATNYLGAFALTGTLLPFVRDEAPARIVNVGSLGHRFAKLDLDDANWERTPYNPWKSYARSKLALLNFTMDLNRRLQQRGSRIIALAAHPGFAATDIGKDSAGLTPTNPMSRWIQERVLTPLIPVAADAARPIVRATCGEDARGGDYYGPSGFLEIGGTPGRARLNRIARDTEVAKRLWSLSESMTGVRFLSE